MAKEKIRPATRTTGANPGPQRAGLPLNRMVKAYAGAHRCTLAAGGQTLPARLIDINAASSHLRLDAPSGGPGLRLDQNALLHARLTASGRILDGLACRVAWLTESEVGLEFDTHLGLGIGELQQALDSVHAAC